MINKKLVLAQVVLVSLAVLTNCRSLHFKQQEELIWHMECNLGVIDDPNCPIDGGWTPWSPWSACQGSCDQMGFRTRTRDCANPPPSSGGVSCSGPKQQTETCHIINCTAHDFKQAIEGDTARTEALRQLEAVPALMDRCLRSECPFETIETALSIDNTWQLNPENVWNSLLCVKYNVGCPVKGEWGAWGEWSSCGARCGGGFKWRLRRCDTPSPSEAQYVCSGSALQVAPCRGDQCAIEGRSTGGVWAQWGKWSTCSESCGVGVRRRRRTCLETHTPLVSGIWGTHCRGQHDQLQNCKNKQCVLNGGWSGWGIWGPCSQTCGVGKRLRSRSCTRPIPSGNGTPCAGPKTEVGSCYLAPCEAHQHTVALFNGDSYLEYDFNSMRSSLMHLYIRFMPLSPQGTLFRRGRVHYAPYIHLGLQKWHICLDAAGFNEYCTIPRICWPNTIEPAVWHTAMISFTSRTITLRLDDDPTTIEKEIPCDPSMLENNMNVIVGEKFYGEIQEVIFNFSPLHIEVDKGHAYNKFNKSPAVARNVAYEKASLEEAFVLLENEYFMRIACPTNSNEWKLELTVKPKRDSGTILFINGFNKWFHIILQNSKLRVKLAIEEYRSESVSASEYLIDQWLDITITKKANAKSIKIVINGGETLHVLFESGMDRIKRKSQGSSTASHPKWALCTNEYYVGGVPELVKNNILETFTPFYGYISSISINSVLYDLHEISKERNQGNTIQLSSKTASISNIYREITWGESGHVNLSCLSTKIARSADDTQWLFLDKGVYPVQETGTGVYSDLRVLRLASEMKNDLTGFYTCRVSTGRVKQNIITYGVVGKTYELSGPDTITAIAVLSTVFLVICTFGWLIHEGIDDLRHGFGFFRDKQLTPMRISTAIARFIENRRRSSGNRNAMEPRNPATRREDLNEPVFNFDTPEPEGPVQDIRFLNNNHVPFFLPYLPDSSSFQMEAPPNLFRFEPNYISTPQHGSITSPRIQFMSSSSLEGSSPPMLSSRIIRSQRRIFPVEGINLNNQHAICPSTRKTRENISNGGQSKKRALEQIVTMFQQLPSNA